MKNFKFLLIVPLALTACSNQLDFSKKAPDEFAVVTRAPLEMPDNYDLPPPKSGVSRAQETSTEEQAKEVLFGNSDEETKETVKQDAISSGETILLQKANAQSAPSNIRDQIDAETQALAEKNRSTVDRILGKVGKTTDVPAEVIDPVKESERLVIEQQK